MTQETLPQDATLFQLTEALISKADHVYLQLERLPSHLRGTGSHTVGGAPSGSQHVGQREPKHPNSACELTNTLWIAISRISSSVNGTRPISRLPPEMLAGVFGWYQCLWSTGRHKRYTWVRLMSVSHAWRSTILSFPFLWSVVHLDAEFSPETIRMLLQRSAGHSLDVTVPTCYPGAGWGFNRYSHVLDASTHASRIRNLVICQDGDRNDLKRLVRIFSMPAPNLTHLDLITSRRHDGNAQFPNWFGLDFPKLRVLELSGIEVWSEVVGANLTRITINYSLNPASLKRCISYSPNLEALVIHCVRDFDDPDLSTWQRIALPAGISLSIEHSDACPRILALFSLPGDGHVKVKPFARSLHNISLLSYIPTDLSHLQNLRALTRLHLKTRFDGWVALELRFFRLNQVAFEINIEFSFDDQRMAQQMTSPAMWFLRDLHRVVLREVEELFMEGFVGALEPRAAELLTLLREMPGLTRLITNDGNEEALRSALDGLGYQNVVVSAEG